MPETWKDVVWPRRVWPPGFKAPVDLAPFIPALKKRADEFKAAGVPVPGVWKHDDSAVPGEEEIAKLSAGDGRLVYGRAKDARIDDRGVLQQLMDVPSDKDAEQLKTVQYCSPWIKWDWRDGSGKVWEGPSILHVAATARPVQLPQDAFKFSFDGTGPLPDLRLALSDYERGDEMAEEPKEPKEKKDAAIKPGGGFDKDVLKCLSDAGIHLPDDTDEKNFFERLRIVCAAKNKGGSSAPVPEPKEAPMPPQVGLSHEQQQQIDRGKRAELFAINAGKQAVRARILALNPRGAISKDVEKELLAMLDGEKAIALSLDDTTGELAENKLLIMLSAYEKNPDGAAMGNARLANGEQPREAPSPADEVNLQTADAITSRLGGKPPKREK
jgi:hypothetical protein